MHYCQQIGNEDFYFRRFSQLYTSSKSQPSTFSKTVAEWNRPISHADNTLSALAPPLPPTFLPPPNPLRLVSNKPDPGAGGRQGSIATSTHPGPPTPTFRLDVDLRLFSLNVFEF